MKKNKDVGRENKIFIEKKKNDVLMENMKKREA